MKGLLSLLFSLVIMSSYSQRLLVPRATSLNTVLDGRLAIKDNLIVPRYVDTGAANLNLGLDLDGAIIFSTSTQEYWGRQASPKKWVNLGSGGTGGSVETASSIRTKLGEASPTTSGYLSAADWSAFNSKQPLLSFTPENVSNRGLPNGYPVLDGGGKIPAQYLTIGALLYRGTWNASTNTPILSNGTGTNGETYRVAVAGTQDLGSGSISFIVGDELIYNGTQWQRSPNSEGVAAVNGLSGDINLTTDNIPESSTKLFITPTEKATYASKQNALGYVPVPPTRTISINGITRDLSANANVVLTTNEVQPAGDRQYLSSAQASALSGLPNISGTSGKTLLNAPMVGDVLSDGVTNTTTIPVNTLSGSKIADASITDAKIASGISASKLTSGTVPIAQLPALTGGDVVKPLSSGVMTIKTDVALPGNPTVSNQLATDRSARIANTKTVADVTKNLYDSLGSLVYNNMGDGVQIVRPRNTTADTIDVITLKAGTGVTMPVVNGVMTISASGATGIPSSITSTGDASALRLYNPGLATTAGFQVTAPNRVDITTGPAIAVGVDNGTTSVVNRWGIQSTGVQQWKGATGSYDISLFRNGTNSLVVSADGTAATIKDGKFFVGQFAINQTFLSPNLAMQVGGTTESSLPFERLSTTQMNTLAALTPEQLSLIGNLSDNTIRFWKTNKFAKILDEDSQIPYANITGTPTTTYNDYSDPFVKMAKQMGSSVRGITMTLNPVNATTANSLIDGDMRLMAVPIDAPTTISSVSFMMKLLGDYTTDATGQNRIGIYSSNGTTLTLIGSSADNPNLYKPASITNYITENLSTPVTISTPGIYYVGLMFNALTTVTAPQVATGSTAPSATQVNGLFTTGRICTRYQGATLPNTMTLASTATLSAPALVTVNQAVLP